MNASAERLSAGVVGASTLDVARVRADFPILAQQLRGRPLVYLDSAASAQKPRQVVEALSNFYLSDFANIHRGVHTLSIRATEAYEQARLTVQRFINAAEQQEIVFVRNCTEAINLVAATYGEQIVGPGDEVLVSAMEHHSNLVPWQRLCERRGGHLRVAPIDDRGDLLVEEFERLLGPRTKIVAVTHMSNALGTVTPVRDLVNKAHAVGAKVLLDGAQAVAHLPVDVQQIECDFYAFSGHKLYGPTGVGVLYGKRELLDAMPPYQTGGGMVDTVTFEHTSVLDAPLRFEAGTPDIAGAVGLSAAIDYLTSLGLDAVSRHEGELMSYATAALSAVPDLRLIGTSASRASVISFALGQLHPHDVGTILDNQGVAIRAGHHCAQPLMQRFGVSATARASLGVYNNRADIDALVMGLHKVLELFQ